VAARSSTPSTPGSARSPPGTDIRVIMLATKVPSFIIPQGKETNRRLSFQQVLPLQLVWLRSITAYAYQMDSKREIPTDTGKLEAAREVRHGIRRAIGELDSALATAAVGRESAWSSELTRRLDVLREAFDNHVAVTESPTGFLSEIVDRAPRLAHAVEKLRLEHASITAALDQASVTSQLVGESPSGVENAREAVLELLHRLALHRQKGAEVVYEAYEVDIEAGD